jgi:hypothetical protein
VKNDAFHILWYVNLYLYMDLMECEINTHTNSLKQREAIQLCFRICHWEGLEKPGGTHIEWDT